MEYDGIIIYYKDELYNKISKYYVCSGITFKDGHAYFKAMGRGYMLDMDRIVRISYGGSEV